MKKILGTELIERVGLVAASALLSMACGADATVNDPGADGTDPAVADDGPMVTPVGPGGFFVPERIPANMKANVDTSWVDALPSNPRTDPVVQANVAGLRFQDLRAAKLGERENLGENAVALVTPDGFYRGRVVAPTDESKRAADGTFVEQGGSIEPRGLSGGVDNRTRLTGTNVPGGVGRVTCQGGTGSGTMVGWRILRTAAHVVVRET